MGKGLYQVIWGTDLGTERVESEGPKARAKGQPYIEDSTGRAPDIGAAADSGPARAARGEIMAPYRHGSDLSNSLSLIYAHHCIIDPI